MAAQYGMPGSGRRTSGRPGSVARPAAAIASGDGEPAVHHHGEQDDQQRDRGEATENSASGSGRPAASPTGQRRRSQSAAQSAAARAARPTLIIQAGRQAVANSGVGCTRVAGGEQHPERWRSGSRGCRRSSRGWCAAGAGGPWSPDGELPGSSQGCSGTTALVTRHARQPDRAPDQLPKSRPRRRPRSMRHPTAGRSARPTGWPRQARRHDRGRPPHQAVRPAHGRRRRLVPLRTGHRDRLPRPERRGQVHHHADDLRADPAHRRAAPRVAGRPYRRAAQPGAGDRGAAGRLRAARRADRPGGAGPGRPHDGGGPAGRSPRSSTWSG